MRWRLEQSALRGQSLEWDALSGRSLEWDALSGVSLEGQSPSTPSFPASWLGTHCFGGSASMMGWRNNVPASITGGAGGAVRSQPGGWERG
jgi:hypothetical protein